MSVPDIKNLGLAGAPGYGFHLHPPWALHETTYLPIPESAVPNDGI